MSCKRQSKASRCSYVDVRQSGLQHRDYHQRQRKVLRGESQSTESSRHPNCVETSTSRRAVKTVNFTDLPRSLFFVSLISSVAFLFLSSWIRALTCEIFSCRKTCGTEMSRGERRNRQTHHSRWRLQPALRTAGPRARGPARDPDEPCRAAGGV